MEVNISTKLTFGNILFDCLRQVGCLIEVTANSGLTVYIFEKMSIFPDIIPNTVKSFTSDRNLFCG